MVETLPAKQEPWVRSLGQEGPLEKGMATPSRILVWEIPWTEEPGGLQSMSCKKLDIEWFLNYKKIKGTNTTYHWQIYGIASARSLNQNNILPKNLVTGIPCDPEVSSKSALCCCSVTKSYLTLWSHGLEHARFLSPRLSPRGCSNSCP